MRYLVFITKCMRILVEISNFRLPADVSSQPATAPGTGRGLWHCSVLSHLSSASFKHGFYGTPFIGLSSIYPRVFLIIAFE